MLGFRCSAPRAVILLGDSSVIGGDWGEYTSNLFDEKHLKLSPNDPPTRFNIRPLSDRQKDIISQQSTLRQRAKMTVRCGWLGHQGYMVQRASGETVVVDQPRREAEGDLGTVIAEAWMRNLGIEGYDGGLRAEHLVGLFQAIEILSEAVLPLSKRSAQQSGRSSESSQASEQSQSQSPETAAVDAPSATASSSGAA